MTICVDWGNSRVKVGLFNATNFMTRDYNFSHEEAVQQIAGIIESEDIQQGILCAVAEVPAVLKEFFDAEPGFMIFDHHTTLPIINAYQTPETLGLDRLAGVVAAHHYNPDNTNLVISVGTALVYSVVTSNKIFRGGAISPGIDMRLKAMHQFTDKLPLVSKEGMNALIGYDTESSIRSGAINGVLFEIESTINAYAEQFNNLKVTISGGDHSLFAMKIKNRIFADPHIILKGLNLIYNYNAT